MPLTLQALRSKTVTVECEVLDEVVHLTFALGRYTSDVDEAFGAFRASLAEAEDGAALTPEQNAQVRSLLLPLLVEWDVLGDDGEPIPITDESLRQIPPPINLAFFLALAEGNQPDPQKAPTSESSTATEPTSSAPSPTGT